MQTRESGWHRKKGILLKEGKDQIGSNLDLIKTLQLIDFLVPVEARIGLDIGSGSGPEIKDISRLGDTRISCDLDPQILRIAKENGKRLIFCLCKR